MRCSVHPFFSFYLFSSFLIASSYSILSELVHHNYLFFPPIHLPLLLADHAHQLQQHESINYIDTLLVGGKEEDASSLIDSLLVGGKEEVPSSIIPDIFDSVKYKFDWLSYESAAVSSSLKFQPPRLPLAPLIQINPEYLMEYATSMKGVLTDTVGLLKDGILPEDNEDIIAIVASEATAGVLGGFSSQVVSILLNDEKRNSLLIEGISDGTFFGIRSLVRILSRRFGLSRPLIGITALVLASLVSESAKIQAKRQENLRAQQGRFIDNVPFDERTLEERTSTLDQEIYDEKIEERVISLLDRYENSYNLSETERKELLTGQTAAESELALNKIIIEGGPVITFAEAAQDISKWVSYNFLLPSEKDFITVAQYGALSGIIGTAFHFICNHQSYHTYGATDKHDVADDCGGKKRREGQDWRLELKFTLMRFSQSALEGAALFIAYEGSLACLDFNGIKFLGEKLPFIPYSYIM